MVKAYLKYKFDKNFNTITTHHSNIVFIKEKSLVITGANQFIQIMNANTGEVIQQLRDQEDRNQPVTTLKIGKVMNILGAGFQDGEIQIWDLESFTIKARVSGHKTSVIEILFLKEDTMMASGSLDTSIIIWDLIAEVSIFKFKGHKNQITHLDFLTSDKIISSSKDGTLRIWNIKTQQCDQILPSHFNEITHFLLNRTQKILLFGASSDKIQIRRLLDEGTHEDVGVIKRNSTARILQMAFIDQFLLVLNAEKSMEIFKMLDKEEMQKRWKRKVKRRKEKGKEVEGTVEEYMVDYSNRFKFKQFLHFKAKARSFQLAKFKKSSGFFINFHDNRMNFYSLQEEKESLCTTIKNYERIGHRSAVRTLALNDSDTRLLSGSQEEIKIWDTETLQCIRTFKSQYCTCSIFLPQNRYAVVGTKNGLLYLIDIPAATIIQTIQAHESSIWSITLHPHPQPLKTLTILTGSADKSLKFFGLTLNEETESLQLECIKTLEMAEDIHCVKFTTSGKYYVVSLLDSSMRVFYGDSDKVFLTLYGHKLPVLALDVSSDNTLLVSASADKNLRFWGLDFGNCHKFIFAHQKAIMAVKFVQDTHYVFSASRDNTIKYWDGDTHQLVLVFEQNLAEVWAIAVSTLGDFVISAANDKSMRKWVQTKEQCFVQIEEEERREKIMVEKYTNDNLKNAETQRTTDTLVDTSEVEKLKYQNVKYGDSLMQTLETAWKFHEEIRQYELELSLFEKTGKGNKPTDIDMASLGGQSLPQFVMSDLTKIKSSEISNTMRFLHFQHISKLLYFLRYFIKNSINLELSCRYLFFILENHGGNIQNSQELLHVVTGIKRHLRKNLQREKDVLGFNLAGLSLMKREIQDRDLRGCKEYEKIEKKVKL